MYVGKKMSIALTNNTKSQYWTKHISIQHHYICKLVDEGKITIKWISSADMLADGMMKALPIKTFKKY